VLERGEAISEQRNHDWLVIDDEDSLRHVRFTATRSCAPSAGSPAELPYELKDESKQN